MTNTAASLGNGRLELHLCVSPPSSREGILEGLGIGAVTRQIHGYTNVVVYDQRLNRLRPRRRASVEERTAPREGSESAERTGMCLGAEVSRIEVAHGQSKKTWANS